MKWYILFITCVIMPINGIVIERGHWYIGLPLIIMHIPFLVMKFNKLDS